MAVAVGPGRSSWPIGGGVGGEFGLDANSTRRRPTFECHPAEHTAGVILITLVRSCFACLVCLFCMVVSFCVLFAGCLGHGCQSGSDGCNPAQKAT